MKYFVFVLLCTLINNDIYSQKEASVWTLSPNATLDFNTPIPVLQNNSVICDYEESNCSISDEFGNLLFYSDGVTVHGSNNSILPNGSNLTSSLSSDVKSCTQGSLLIKKPGSINQYFLFSLSSMYHSFEATLSYSLIDKTLNSGFGDVFVSNFALVTDKLSEKMNATKHCNNKDIWLVLIKYTNLTKETDEDYSLEFLSYLITSEGIQFNPVKSTIDTSCPLIGQMKFNNAGNELAIAAPNELTLFSFDNSTGTVSLKKNIYLPLENGYGVEYAPNDSLIYINEKQYDFQTGQLTQLLNYNCPTQLQRGYDNKIYGFFLTQDEILTNQSTSSSFNSNNNWAWIGNNDNINHISVINNPEIAGVDCDLMLQEYSIFSPGNFKNYITSPNFPSYYFNHKPSDFSYTGTCEGEEFNFFLTNSSPVDSVLWNFHETGDEIIGLSVDYTFSESGDWQVSCTVYQNGVATTSTQCVNVCGINNVLLPSIVDLCENDPFEINALNTCSVSYKWNTGDTTSAIFIDTEGEYILETTNECGVFYDTMEVIKSDICNLLVEIPNVITVNNDNVNDVFSINVKNVKSFNYSILNRWGNIIYSNQQILTTSQYNYWNTFQLWDGKTSNGLDIIDGTYFYHIDFTLLNNEIINKSGFIEVVH